MAFGNLFGGGGSGPVQKLASGKLKDQEKAQALQELQGASAEDLVPLLCVDDAQVASRAAQVFLPKANEAAAAALLDDLLGRATNVATGLKVLVRCREELLRALFDERLTNPRPDVSRKLWEFALELPASLSDALLPRAVKEAPAAPRLMALRKLLKSKGAEALRPVLLEAAENKDAQVRKEALTALAQLPGDDVFTVMLERLGADDSKDIRDFAAKYLEQFLANAPPEMRPRVLGRLLLAGDPAQRASLVKSMFGQPKSDSLLSGVLQFCKTLTGVQHKMVMDALTSVGESLIPRVIQHLSATDADLRVQAIYLLEAFGDVRTVGSLLNMVRDPDWWVRIVTAEALGRMKEPRVIPALRELFADNDARWAAIEAVSRLGGEGAIAALLPLLNDPSPEVRSATVDAMAWLPDQRIQDALTELSKRDASTDVRLKAVEVLRKLQGQARGVGSMVVSSAELQKPLEKMLAYIKERSGSDLHLTPGEPPLVRVNGVIERIPAQKLGAEVAEKLLLEVLDPVRKPILDQVGAVDFCYSIPGVGRFRTNIFKMKRGLAGVFRAIPNHPPTLDELGMPGHLTDLTTFHQGIVLVTGPAGSGKTTTLTALVNLVNESKSSHVLTFEDPVEFVHKPLKALINQREIGRDSQSYAAAMRGALREDPDIIVVGDMRDPETIRLALLAAETGHLVIATMQTTGAIATIDKLVDSFPPEEQGQVRSSLAESLKLIISQVLVPRADGKGRVATFEVLKSSSSVRSLIRDGKSVQLASAMVIGRSLGMQTLDGALEELVRAGKVTFESALAFAQSKDAFAKLKPAPAGAAPAPAASPQRPAPARPSAPGAAPPLLRKPPEVKK